MELVRLIAMLLALAGAAAGDDCDSLPEASLTRLVKLRSEGTLVKALDKDSKGRWVRLDVANGTLALFPDPEKSLCSDPVLAMTQKDLYSGTMFLILIDDIDQLNRYQHTEGIAFNRLGNRGLVVHTSAKLGRDEVPMKESEIIKRIDRIAERAQTDMARPTKIERLLEGTVGALRNLKLP